MKTIKTKITLSPDQEALFDRLCSEADWLWNLALEVSLKLHSERYYKWLRKQKNIDLDGIIEVPIFVGDRSAFSGVTCQIAIADRCWERDADRPIIYKDKKGRTCKKDGFDTPTAEAGGILGSAKSLA